MKILLDTCVWNGCIPEIEAAGHDVEWAGDWGIDPGDEEILDRARQNGQILITLDKDFGEIAVVRRRQHPGIVRIVGGSVGTFARRVLFVIERYSEDLLAGAIVTAETSRIRIRSGQE